MQLCKVKGNVILFLFMYRHTQVYASLTVVDTAGAARDICDAKSVQ